MISKETVYKYLSTGILTEGWFNFKEDDPEQDQAQTQDQDQTTDNQNPNDAESNANLDWHFKKEDLILYSGSTSEPKSQYYPFADEIRYAEFKKEDKDKDKDKDLFSKNFKTGARNFGLGLISGGLAATVDATSKAFNSKIDKDKKDKNGNTDKWKDAAINSFSGADALDQFKLHAQEHHVPSSLIDDFINTYKAAKANVANQQSSNKQNNTSQNTTNNVK